MTSIYQKLALAAVGTALSLTALEVNSAQAALNIVENNSLNTKQSNLIATAYRVNLYHYYLTANTDGKGYFSVSHGIPSNYRIVGIEVAIQHKNGNWHTLEYSNNVDNRFWWNDKRVEGIIASPNFYYRSVRIVIKVLY